jgi:RNA polymerase sigma-70 factor (ECF subfamily)
MLGIAFNDGSGAARACGERQGLRALAALQLALEGDLTDKQRRVLVAELSGMPHAEIALQLGMNRNALYKLAHDARKKLKGRLEAAGLSAEEVLWAFT